MSVAQTTAQITTGYGRLDVFNGTTEKYPGWQRSFTSRMHLFGLGKVFTEDVPDPANNVLLYHYIISSVDSVTGDLIEDDNQDGMKAFNILKERFQGTPADRVQTLMVSLFELSMGQEETAIEYISRVESLKNNLTSMKQTFPKTSYSILALNGLTDKYDLFKAIMKSKSPFPDWVEFSALLATWNSEKFKTSERNHADADVVLASKFTGDRRTCNYCKKPRHIEKDCWKKKRAEEERWCEYCRRTTHNTTRCHFKPKDPPPPAERLGAVRDEVAYEDDVFNDA